MLRKRKKDDDNIIPFENPFREGGEYGGAKNNNAGVASQINTETNNRVAELERSNISQDIKAETDQTIAAEVEKVDTGELMRRKIVVSRELRKDYLLSVTLAVICVVLAGFCAVWVATGTDTGTANSMLTFFLIVSAGILAVLAMEGYSWRKEDKKQTIALQPESKAVIEVYLKEKKRGDILTIAGASAWVPLYALLLYLSQSYWGSGDVAPIVIYVTILIAWVVEGGILVRGIIKLNTASRILKLKNLEMRGKEETRVKAGREKVALVLSGIVVGGTAASMLLGLLTITSSQENEIFFRWGWSLYYLLPLLPALPMLLVSVILAVSSKNKKITGIVGVLTFIELAPLLLCIAMGLFQSLF